MNDNKRTLVNHIYMNYVGNNVQNKLHNMYTEYITCMVHHAKNGPTYCICIYYSGETSGETL